MDEMKRAALAELERRSNQLMRAYAFELTSRIKKSTPVDTGRARANWNVSVNKPNVTRFDVGDDPSAYAQRSRVKDGENAQNVSSTNFWNGDVGWIANGLPYIRRLEIGWSKQAPEGMVRLNIEALRPWFLKQAASKGFEQMMFR